MKEIFELFQIFVKQASVPLIVLVIGGYFLKYFIEKWIGSRMTVIDGHIKSAISIKEGLRGHEADELAAFRVAVEKWQYFLETGVFGDAMQADEASYDKNALANKDIELFGNVRVAIVKCATYLRDPELEARLMAAVTSIRGLYYPLILQAADQTGKIQGQMRPYILGLKWFEESKFKDLSLAPTPVDARALASLRAELTQALQVFHDDLLAQIRPILEQIVDLKNSINTYIYRPLPSATQQEIG